MRERVLCKCKKNEQGIQLNKEDGTTIQLSEEEFNCIYEFGKRTKLKEELLHELHDIKRILLKDSHLYCSEILADPVLIEKILDAKLKEEEMVDPILYTAEDLLDKDDQRFPYAMELTISCPQTRMSQSITIRGSSVETLKSKIKETVKWMCSEEKIVGTSHLETLFTTIKNGKLFHVDIDSCWFTLDEYGNLEIEI